MKAFVAASVAVLAAFVAGYARLGAELLPGTHPLRLDRRLAEVLSRWLAEGAGGALLLPLAFALQGCALALVARRGVARAAAGVAVTTLLWRLWGALLSESGPGLDTLPPRWPDWACPAVPPLVYFLATAARAHEPAFSRLYFVGAHLYLLAFVRASAADLVVGAALHAVVAGWPCVREPAAAATEEPETGAPLRPAAVSFVVQDEQDHRGLAATPTFWNIPIPDSP